MYRFKPYTYQLKHIGIISNGYTTPFDDEPWQGTLRRFWTRRGAERHTRMLQARYQRKGLLFTFRITKVVKFRPIGEERRGRVTGE